MTFNRGYFEIGIYHPKKESNYGTLLRSAYQLGAAGAFVIGPRFKKQTSDTTRSHRHMPIRQYQSFDDLKNNLPYDSQIVAIESPEYGGKYLKNFIHPIRAIYLLGAEDSGLPQHIVNQCHSVVSIEHVRTYSFNVSVAGSIVIYDRLIKS